MSNINFDILIWGDINIPPTQSLKPFKGPVNTFELTPKLERTLPCFGNISCDIHTNINFDIWIWRGGYEYHMKICRMTAKFFPTWGLIQRYCPGH
jgi:hypothetical protein